MCARPGTASRGLTGGRPKTSWTPGNDRCDDPGRRAVPAAMHTRRTRKGRTARDLERAAATAPPGVNAGRTSPPGEAVAMLARRGFRPTPAPLDVPFPPDLEGEGADRLVDRLRHYGFRLFLRGAIQRPDGFRPA